MKREYHMGLAAQGECLKNQLRLCADRDRGKRVSLREKKPRFTRKNRELGDMKRW